MNSLILFASGTGTNTQAIIDHFRHTSQTRVTLVVTNNTGAGVLKIAAREGIPFFVADRVTYADGTLEGVIRSCNPSLLVLAGFLWKIPASIVDAYPGKIVNIHPALLPSFGGKGMYGENVHKAVLASGTKHSGITIHYVNEHYDEGDIILQAHCPIFANDNPHSLAQRIHKLEHFYFPRAIEFLLCQVP